jgi:hypothetical protein
MEDIPTDDASDHWTRNTVKTRQRSSNIHFVCDHFGWTLHWNDEDAMSNEDDDEGKMMRTMTDDDEQE